ncbi:MAG: putative Chase2 sensor protein [Armatimonadetes bacterium]|nr:putative Chase2 sensor protein [Armatimonadota bacterium]
MKTQAAPKTSGTRNSGRGLRLWLGSGIVGLVAFGLAWGLQHGLLTNRNFALELLQAVVAYDGGMTQHAYRELGRQGARPPVTVVEISKGTYDQIQRGDFSQVPGTPFRKGQPVRFQVYQRWFHTRVLRNLTKLGARVVAFDIVFSGADPELDPDFARAIKENGRVVLAAVNDVGKEAGYDVIRSVGLEYPSSELLAASAGLGMATLPEDPDEGTLRRFQWGTIGIDYDTGEDAAIPTLGVAVAALFKGVNPKTVLQTPQRAGHRFLGHPIQVVGGKMPEAFSYITYFGPAGDPVGPGSVIPYEALLDLEHPSLPIERLRELVKDHIVVVGSSAASDQDVHRVPVVTQQEQLGPTHKMPGVEVQAHVIQTVLSGKYIEQATERTRVLLLLCACLVVALAGRVLSPRALILIGSLLILALCWGSAQMVLSARLWLEPVTASIGVAFATLFETLFMYLAEHKARIKVRRQLRRHLGADVAEALDEREWPEWGGESREMTLLFSDLQGFTSLSETMTPPEICHFLNRYCEVIIPVLDRHGAGVDKIMGDGVMAHFGALQRQPDHATRAVRCSLEIQQALDEWTSLPENRSLPPLRTRIGLHTGTATVGEIGAADRAEFTVIGDIVNVASRLEGMNKEFGTRILISDATREAAGEIVPMRFRGLATVRGREEPMAVYSVEEGPTGSTGTDSADLVERPVPVVLSK